ncbi:MAG: hypothetical protein AAFY28_16310 [Actinomycetota bacterium]
MTQLPPPSFPAPPTPEVEPPRSRHGWVIGASIVGVGLGVGGLVVGATALASSSGDEPASTVSADASPAAIDSGNLPPELDEFIAGAEEFGACITGQIDLPTHDADGGPLVIVADPSGDGELQIIEFGDADGSITIERSADDLTVDTTTTSGGDITTTTGDDLIASLDDLFADLGTAFEACEGSLPPIPPLGDIFGDIPGLEDFNLDDFNLDDFSLDDFSLDDFSLDQLPGLEDFNLDDFDLDQFEDFEFDFNFDDFDLEEFDLDDFDIENLPSLDELFDRFQQQN